MEWGLDAGWHIHGEWEEGETVKSVVKLSVVTEGGILDGQQSVGWVHSSGPGRGAGWKSELASSPSESFCSRLPRPGREQPEKRRPKSPKELVASLESRGSYSSS